MTLTMMTTTTTQGVVRLQRPSISVSSPRLHPLPPTTSSPRRKHGALMLKCSLENRTSDKALLRRMLCGMVASCMFLSEANLVHAAELYKQNNLCQLAGATASQVLLPFDARSGEVDGQLMMMRGMTAKDFDPIRYAGRWFEVASLKGGFAGLGQEDCHCTQGVYTVDVKAPSIQVDTFCIHGGPDGYITGIRGRVQCLSEEDTEKSKTDLERQEMIKEKCYLRFPTLPFIPKEPYDVVATDYDNFSLVSGAKDQSFIQIYSRTPNPGPAFIKKYKDKLADLGYDSSKIKDTPQDCEVMSNAKLSAMMSASAMQQALNNQFPDLELKSPLELDPFTSVLDTLKKLIELYFK